MFTGRHNIMERIVSLLAWLTLLAALAPVGAASAGDVLWLEPGSDRFPLHDHLRCLEDPSGKLTMAEVTSPEFEGRFRSLPGGVLRPGWTDTTFWLRLTLARRDAVAPSSEYIFDLAQTTNVVATLFTPRASPDGHLAWRETAPLGRSGQTQFLPSQFSHFILPTLTDQPQTIYIRVLVPLGLDALPEVLTRAGFQRRLLEQTLLTSVMLSVLILLAINHLAMYYSLRNNAYLWYAVFLLSLGLFLGFISGLMQNLAPGTALFHDIVFPCAPYGLALLARTLFVRSFLPLKRLFPFGDRLLVALMIIFLPVIFLPLLGPGSIPWIKFFMVLAPLRMLSLLYIGMVCWRRGFKPAGFYILATLPQMLGSQDFVLVSLGFGAPLPVSMYYLQQVGLVFEALVLALALVQQVKVMRQEREDIERQALLEAREHQARLRCLAGELVRSEERQRRVLAEDLHDSISQNLATSLLRLRLRAAGQDGRPPDAELAGTCELLHATLEQTRALTFDISPPVLHDYGLEASLEWLAERMEQRHGLRVDFESRGALPCRNESLEANLFRAAQELLVNVVKHAGASRAGVSLVRQGHMVSVRVTDDGRGMPNKVLAPVGSEGFGLYSIRERLLALGGVMDIESRPDQGVTITLSAPWPGPGTPQNGGGADEDHDPAG